jgi:hypothetical protein
MLATALVPIAESLGSDIAATGWLIAALYLTTRSYATQRWPLRLRNSI